MCWMRWRVLATSAPKWAMVLSSSRKCKRGMRSAQLGGEGLSSWYGSKNRPDAGGREHRHGGLGLHTAADIHYGRRSTPAITFRRSAGFRLVLVALPVLALAGVPLRGVDGTVDLLVVLMVGVALGEPCYFVDPPVGLLRVLLGVGLRLLLQVAELAHAILLCLSRSALPPGRVLLRAYPYAGH